MAGIYMHWFEKTYMFNEDSRFKENIVFWKRQMDDVFFVWRGKKEDLELFVWLLNGIVNKVQFTLDIEKDNFLPFLDVGITKFEGTLITKVYRKPTHTQQYINWNYNHPKNMLLGVLKPWIGAQGTCALRQKGGFIGGVGFTEKCFCFKWVSGEAGAENSPGVLGKGDT